MTLKVLKNKLNLRARAIIATSLVVISVATALSAFLIRHEEIIIDTTLKQRGFTLASNLAYNAEYGVLAQDTSVLNNLLRGIMKQPDVVYSIIQTLDGKVLVGEGYKSSMDSLPKFQIFKLQDTEEYEPMINYFKSSGEEFYDVAFPITSTTIDIPSNELGLFLDDTIDDKKAQEVIGVARIGLSLAGAKLLQKESSQTATVITLAIILIAGMITTILTGIAIAPIQKLVEGTRRIAQGELDYKVEVKSGGELGQLAQSFNTMTDDLKRSRDQLVIAKEYTENIIRSMVDILVVVDQQGIIQRVNPAAQLILGYDEVDLIGEPIDLVISTEGQKVSPRVHMTRKLMRDNVITDFELDFQKKSGQSFPVLFSGAVMKDEHGNPEGIVGIAKDITDRKQAEEELQQSNERFNTLASNMPGMIYQFVLNPEGNMSFPYVSPGSKEIFGLEPEMIMSDAMSAIGMVHPDDRGDFEKSINTSARTLKPWRWEGRFERNGELKWMQGASRPKKMDDGSVLWDGLLLDVSERKVAQSLIELKTKMLEKVNKELIDNEKKLKLTINDLEISQEELKKTQFQLFQSEKLKVVGRLASGVAHEVKNPLAIILQGVSYLSRKLPKGNKEVDEVLYDVNYAIQRADSVIKGVLDFSAVSELQMTENDINKVIEATLVLVRHEFKQARITVEQEFDDKLPKLNVDKNKLEQVFVNLFLNSVQAMDKGGTLTIRTYEKAFKFKESGVGRRKDDVFKEGDRVVHVEIDDTGSGIKEEVLEKIFDPFFTTKGGSGGTGLGLSIISNIIELHNGEIYLENRDEGGVRTTVVLKV